MNAPTNLHAQLNLTQKHRSGTMLKRISMILLLAAGGLAFAQGNGNGNGNGNGQGNPNRVTGLSRAAERHALKAERALAEGRRLLRGPGLSGKPQLNQRLHVAEQAYRGKQQQAEQLLRTAQGSGADAESALNALSAMLEPGSLVDSESRLVAAAPQSLQPLSGASSIRSEPGAADLQPTLDAPHTQAIRDLAGTLANNPVRIHEWVRKNIHFVPTRGSIQGAHGTLATRRGNATDIASLEVALLRSAGVHARYVRGQIEVDSARMQRWFGVDRIEAVTELLSEGGIAFETVIEAGAIARIRLEHVWVEAFVDMAPSRGAKHVSGDAWVAVDAAFKDLRFTAGPDLLTWMALDPAALTAAINAAAVLDTSAGTLSTLGADALATLLDDASADLARALSEHALSDAQLNVLLARASDQTPDLPYLMGTHSYQIRSARTPEAELPDSERAKLGLSVRIEDNGLPGDPLASLNQATVALFGQPLELRFAPAGDADRDVLAAMLPSTVSGFVDLPEAVPAYLVEMRGELRLGATILSQSQAYGMGRGLYYQLTLVRPDGSRYEQNLRGHVGETRSFVQNWNNGVGGELSDAITQMRAHQATLASNPQSARELASAALRSTGLGHYAAANVYQDWLAGLSRVSWHRSLSLSSSYLALEVEAPFGLVMSAMPQGVGLSDVSPLHIGAELQRGDESRFARESLSAQAAFGYQLLEQMFEGGARSATRVFLSSLANNEPVHTLAPAQITQFDQLTLPTPLRDPLRAGLVAGDRATFNANARDVHGWTGHGGQQDYPDARGGTSYVFGRVNPDANAHLTGANVTALKARGLAWTQWLGDSLPANIRSTWTQEVESFLAAGDGLVHLSNDARAIALSPTLSRIIAGTAIDHAVAGRVDPLIDQHLWAQMLWPEISIAAILDPIAPTLTFDATPLEITLGASTQLSASISDNRPGATLSVSADGQIVTLADGQATYTPSRAGIVPLVARGRDAAGNVVTKTLELRVLAPNDASAPVVKINAPIDNAAVTEPTHVFGSVSDDSLVRWTLYLRPGNSPNATPIRLGEGNQNISNADVGLLDPTMMFNGVYILILEGEDAAGRKANDSVQVRIDGDMKLGHFSITFVDAEIPLAGIPIRITRTYDTRQAKESLDFGHGWSVDYQNVRVRESRKLGFAWKLAQEGGGFGQWCVKPSGSPVVTVTLPSGETEQFMAKFHPECTSWVPTVYGQLTFEPLNPGTKSTLEQLDFGTLRWANIAGGGSNLIDMGAEDPTAPVDPSNYKLTASDGNVYILDQAFGVRIVRDPAGNQISYTPQGIVHSSGTSIQFIRDAQKRITAIVLPDGRRLNYEYDAKGDLIAMRDQLDNATRYGYLPNVRYPHYLQDIIDARGVRAVRNEYDDDGRLTATVDGDGKRQEFVHDIAGRVERVRNRRGFETIYVYDDNGWVLSETNSLGEQTVRTYDSYGNELSVTDPLGRKTEFKLDPRGNVLEERDPTGATTKRTWGYFEQMYTETDALGRVLLQNTYARNYLTGDETGYVTSMKDAVGNVTSTPVDICGTTCPNTGNLKAVIDPTGARTSFEYDRAGNIIRETGPLGYVTDTTFDSMGRMASQTRTRQVAGQTETLTTKYTYDAKGNLVRTEFPDGSFTTSQFDAVGNVIAETDALNRTTRFEYDSVGNQVRKIFPDETWEASEFDAEGNLVAETDRAGRVTRMTYDAEDRLIETIFPDDTPATDADNPRLKNVYDDAGQVVATIDERGAQTTYAFDDAGRQVEVVDALGNATTKQYDVTGRMLSTVDALGRKTQFEYDAAGKLVATILPDPLADDGNDANNPKVTVAYDGANRKIEEVDEMGRKSTYAYDKLGRMTSITIGAHSTTPATTNYEYDELGNKIAQVDALGRRTEWTYDKMGRMLSRKLPMGQIETFAYNAAGEMIRHIGLNGTELSYAYDVLGRVKNVTFPDGTFRVFEYSASGNVSSIVEAGFAYQFTYDALDRLLSATDAEGRRIEYGYDAAGNRTELKTPSTTVTYQYDALNRLSEVVANLAGQPHNQRSTYQYDEVGNRKSQTQANGSTVSYGYDRRNRLSNLAHRTAAGALLLGLSYNVDASGLRTQILETKQNGVGTVQTRSATYGYDALKRLTSSNVTGTVSAQALNETFTYDKVGNRLTRTCGGQIRTCSSGRNASTAISSITTTSTYDANDRLMRETDTYGTYDYAYDAAGNLLSKRQGTTTLASYTWDVENRLRTATLTPAGAAGNKTTTRYTYDASGIRRASEVVAQTVGTGASITKTRTSFLVDPNQSYAQVLEDWTAKATLAGATEPTLPEASLQNSYVFGDDLIAEARYAALAGNPVPRDPTDGGHDANARIGSISGSSVFHYDGLGSTRLLSAYNVDASGNPVTTGTAQNHANEAVTDSYAYSAFGEPDIASTSGATENSYRFTGEQFDANLGWYYVRARYMNPTQGRMLSMDPFPGLGNDPVTVHKYLWANDSPVMYVDPSGYFSLAEMGAAQNIATRLIMMSVKDYAWDMITGAFVRGLIGQMGGTGKIPDVAGASGAGIVTSLALMCRSSSRRCLLKGIPTFVSGLEMPATTLHVLLAEFGHGTTSEDEPKFLPFLLSRGKSRNDVHSRRQKKGCMTTTPGLVCDEYPYASTEQGGNQRWKDGRVSLQLTPGWEGPIQGNKIKKFYRKAGLSTSGGVKNAFLNVGLPTTPSGFINLKGKWQKL